MNNVGALAWGWRRVQVEVVQLRVEEGISCRASLDGGSSSSSSTESHDYSDAEDECWHSPYTSNGGGAYDDDDPAHADLEKGLQQPEQEELKEAANHPNDNGGGVREAQLERTGSGSGCGCEKECRICHLGVEAEVGTSIVLGCACKDDLAVAHKHCAEAWFKIKGNRTCEICGSTAMNVVGIEETDFMEQWNEGSATTTNTEPRNFWRGHRFLNFLLACMVLAFVISWLFHFNIPS
ncbi:hypothetical protein KI387_043870 [Taxus chinensis]|uniref:RING-CH-type domain-containing protein n=1 Tax=Taxus chinensis TaxID=29808 RepID=A0AA38CRH5_TAXCH|nr:hypothetical protein KI387_043870 [Taxus chinensis]